MNHVYCVITNIPVHFHVRHLRQFFSRYVEMNKISMFHFLHRNQNNIQSLFPKVTIHLVKTPQSKEPCKPPRSVVVAIPKEHIKEFMFDYNKENWSGTKNEILNAKCCIQLLPKECFEKCKALREMHPPALMPNGNVGTPSSHFLPLIQQCKLSSKLIFKLGLKFSVHRRKGVYGSVKYNYDVEGQGSKTLSDDSEPEEEWDRYESLHDDVGNQERLNPRRYEEEMEVVWDKGSSGLVFHTDAALWDDLKGDFDEKTHDDWDVDMSAYFDDPGSEDKDAQDLLQIRSEHLFNMGDSSSQRGQFEKHTRGIGHKVMMRYGWSDGKGLGVDNTGIADPIISTSKPASCLHGFGFYETKSTRKLPSDTPSFTISTIYDTFDEEKDQLLLSASLTANKKCFIRGGLLTEDH